MDNVDIVRQYYDDNVQDEWNRLERHIAEFGITRRVLAQHIRPGDRVLDMGGGPGRYSLHLAGQGCDVTLADLSPGNVAFAAGKAEEAALPLRTLCADARNPAELEGESFDHVLLMGPLYHLTQEEDRRQAVRACLNLLRPGGTLFAAFISSNAATWDLYSRYPTLVLQPDQRKFLDLLVQDLPYTGHSFTQSFFIRPADVLPFFAPFPLEKLHLVGCESFLALRDLELAAQPPEVRDAWLDVAAEVCERQDLLSMSEHILYVGRKLQ